MGPRRRCTGTGRPIPTAPANGGSSRSTALMARTRQRAECPGVSLLSVVWLTPRDGRSVRAKAPPATGGGFPGPPGLRLRSRHMPERVSAYDQAMRQSGPPVEGCRPGTMPGWMRLEAQAMARIAGIAIAAARTDFGGAPGGGLRAKAEGPFSGGRVSALEGAVEGWLSRGHHRLSPRNALRDALAAARHGGRGRRPVPVGPAPQRPGGAPSGRGTCRPSSVRPGSRKALLLSRSCWPMRRTAGGSTGATPPCCCWTKVAAHLDAGATGRPVRGAPGRLGHPGWMTGTDASSCCRGTRPARARSSRCAIAR